MQLIDRPVILGRMEREGYYQHERDPLAEAREHIRNIDLILARLIESGHEFDPHYRQQLRMLLQQYLGLLGIRSAEQLFERRVELNIEWERELPPPTSTYPSKQDFQRRLLAVVLSDQQGSLQELPPVAQSPKAAAIAEFAQHTWASVQGRNNQYTLDYLYELGKIMSSEAAYSVLFPENDALVVARNWHIENGPHRALTLRTLGARYATRSGMNRWIIALRNDVAIRNPKG